MRLITRGLVRGARSGGGTIINPPPPPPPPPTSGPTTDTGGGTPTPLGNTLAPYLHQPGQVITAAAGTYGPGSIDFHKIIHQANSAKENNGWIIVVAEELGACTLDLTGSMLNLQYDAVNNPLGGGFAQYQRLPARIMLVGWKVLYGRTAWWWLDRLRFWYCDFSCPIEDWNDRYRAAYHTLHGSYPSLLSTVDTNATNLMGDYITATPVGFNFVDHAEFFFCDFHDNGEDGVYMSASNALFHGCRWWNHGTKGYDYISPSFPGQTHMHPDGIQAAYGNNITLRKFALGAHWESDTDNGSNTWDISDGWTFDTAAHSGGDSNGHRTTGSWRRVKWFGFGRSHAVGHPELPDGYDPDSDAFIYTFPGAYEGPPTMAFYLDDGTQVSGSRFASENHLTGASLPSGITLTAAGGHLLSEAARTAVLEHAANPAQLAKAEAHSDTDEWQDYFAAAGGPGWP